RLAFLAGRLDYGTMNVYLINIITIIITKPHPSNTSAQVIGYRVLGPSSSQFWKRFYVVFSSSLAVCARHAC
ncbi:MAG: hypothetical protein ACRC9V_10140, partial [Aeromonas sp.]